MVLIDILRRLYDWSPAPWWVDLSATLAALYGLWRYGGKSCALGFLNLLRAIHLAIDAMPQIATYLAELKEIVEAKVLTQLENGDHRFTRNEAAIDNHEQRITTLESIHLPGHLHGTNDE